MSDALLCQGSIWKKKLFKRKSERDREREMNKLRHHAQKHIHCDRITGVYLMQL